MADVSSSLKAQEAPCPCLSSPLSLMPFCSRASSLAEASDVQKGGLDDGNL